MAGRRRDARESFAERRERRAAVDDPAVVLEAAARFLEARSRSVAEVRRRLVGAGYRPELVDGAIARMTELGMLDDEAFARAWVESRDRARPRGERAIREELRLKGIDRETVDLVLGERRDRALVSSEPRTTTATARRPAPTGPRPNGSSRRTPGPRSRRGSAPAAPARLRAARPATGSIPRRAARWRRRWSQRAELPRSARRAPASG